MKVLAVSDVSMGYGSRQISYIVDYLGNFYKAEKIIIEPDQMELPPQHYLFPGIKIHRLIGSTHPYSNAGRIEFILKASKFVDRIRPDILIICTTYTLPTLFKIKFKPKKVIYYCLESISHYDGDLEMNQNIDSKVDLIIFPEENRARIHLDLTKTKVPSCIVLNATNPCRKIEPVPFDKRNNRIIYNGRIHQGTAYDYFLNPKVQNFPIDMYGLVESLTISDKHRIDSQLFSLNKNVQYKGHLPFDKLLNLRKLYLFSIVIWLPLNENTQYACPNKFFESIFDGVPPITTPQPQCKMICKRYDCGIVMEDYSFESFLRSIKQALDLDKSRYLELVDNCNKAILTELNWDTQMKAVMKFLE